MTTYVVTRPGRELLFTVVSQDEKYKAKVMDIFQLQVRKSVLLIGKVTVCSISHSARYGFRYA